MAKKTTLKTNIHTFCFNISKEAENKEWEVLCKKMKGRHKMEVIPNNRDHYEIEFGPIELETEFGFNNQWNSDKGRVFDFYINVFPNEDIKSGHYIDFTEEILQFRKNTYVCGYCGNNQSKPESEFCLKCIGNSHLNVEELHLLRYVALEVPFNKKREKLTEEEKNILLPLFIKAKTKFINTNKKKMIKELHKECEKRTFIAQHKRDGFEWLLNNNFNIDNVIFYEHSDTFCFGYRNSYSEETKEKLMTQLLKFPFEFEIKI